MHGPIFLAAFDGWNSCNRRYKGPDLQRRKREDWWTRQYCCVYCDNLPPESHLDGHIGLHDYSYLRLHDVLTDMLSCCPRVGRPWILHILQKRRLFIPEYDVPKLRYQPLHKMRWRIPKDVSSRQRHGIYLSGCLHLSPGGRAQFGPFPHLPFCELLQSQGRYQEPGSGILTVHPRRRTDHTDESQIRHRHVNVLPGARGENHCPGWTNIKPCAATLLL
ncbi:hypothetical protein RvY_17639-2 [Ramazzottius varieornatus]|uniref:Uncharacterized protein n=1 Tax=Ramazzottius varieornatus TaxID=947166 RepID=A0A1D1W2U6_RAMVA|nr:hypothetical protein RvY_17639-2 [Ramazzottius varieornatus]